MSTPSPSAHEGTLHSGGTELYFRETGHGQAIIILHGGPDFDHTYLLPELDRLADGYRLIYYDQRGRGRSATNVQPEDVSIQSEIEDIESLREYFQLESMAVLGHSWGGLLALEYALRHPERVSHLILLNTAPVSHADYLLFRQDRLTRAAADMEMLQAGSSDSRYQEGDPDTMARYYRIHFGAALRQPEHLEQIIQSLRSSFTKEGILKARKIEERLINETWLSSNYNLLPHLKHLNIPTLIMHGDHDFIPVACATHIAQSFPGARFVLLKECGHFSYLECPEGVHQAIDNFFHVTQSLPGK